MRCFRLFALLCSLTLLSAASHAQSDVFGAFSYTSLHASNVNEVNTNGTVVDTTFPITLNKAGAAVGTDIKILGSQHRNLGIDIRGTFSSNVQQVFGGARFAADRRYSHFHPYAIVGGGFAFINLTETITTISKAPFLPSTSVIYFPNDNLRGLFAAYLGADTSITEHFAWRVEAGGGFTSSASLGLTTSPGGGFFTLNTGPVLRF